MTGEMTDTEVADQIERADRFIADFREMMRGALIIRNYPSRSQFLRFKRVSSPTSQEYPALRKA
jgi:hypothetical protein